MLHCHIETGIDAIFRLKKNQWAEIVTFWKNKGEIEKVVTLFPEGPTLHRILKVNPTLDIRPLRMRLLKYRIDGKTYVLGTTVFESCISGSDFQTAYHARWKIEELYKTSKQIFAIEKFHARNERGVKQEWNAHLAAISMNRVFAQHADRTRPLPERRPIQVSRSCARRLTNFKHTVGNFYRNIESLVIRGASMFWGSIDSVLMSARRRFLLERPGRRYPRISYAPIGKFIPAPMGPKSKRSVKRAAAAIVSP